MDSSRAVEVHSRDGTEHLVIGLGMVAIGALLFFALLVVPAVYFLAAGVGRLQEQVIDALLEKMGEWTGLAIDASSGGLRLAVGGAIWVAFFLFLFFLAIGITHIVTILALVASGTVLGLLFTLFGGSEERDVDLLSRLQFWDS